ncbi:PA14 domain-containing protein [Pseudomonas nicosulfuronedens]
MSRYSLKKESNLSRYSWRSALMAPLAMSISLSLVSLNATANEPMTGLPTGSPTAIDPLAPASQAIGPVLINEVSAAAWNGAKDQDGEAKDWVELYNPSTYTVDVSRWGLSNKSESPFRWAIPAGTTIGANKYLVIWLSKKDRAVVGKQLHASFSLDNGADTLTLTQPNGAAAGALVDSASPALTKADQTWCRMPSGDKASPFRICDKATQGAVNSGDSWEALAASPTITPRGGIYADAQTVKLAGPEGAELRYTLDGSHPTLKSTLYSGPFTVSKGQSVRAASFESGKGPNRDATESYVIDPAGKATFANQRILLLTMTPTEAAAYKAKSKSALFAPNVDLRESDGTEILHTDTSGSVAGSVGSTQDQGTTALNVSLKDSQGAKEFTYPLFPRKGTQTLDKFRLRNAGSDYWYAHLRDNVGGVSMQNSDSIWSDYAPVQVFLNGEYYGVLDTREREDDSLVASSTGTSKDAVQFFSGDQATAGGALALSDYNAMISWFKSTDMSKPENYAEAQKRVNVQNVAEVTAAFNWSAVWDWPWKNQQVWRSTALDNKWQWKVHDWDITQDSAGHDWGGDTRVNYNMYSSRLTSAGQEAYASLMKNPQFRTLFINAMADDLNTRFSSQTAVARIDELASQIRPYIPAFRAKYPSLGTAEKWDTVDIPRLRNFSRDRAEVLDKQTQSQFKLTARQPLTVSTSSTAMGSVLLNTLDLAGYWTADNPRFTGAYYPEAPVTLTARPLPGYRFTGWSGASSSTDAVLTLPVVAATTLTANFVKIDAKKPLPPSVAPQAAITSRTGDYAQVQMEAADPQGYTVTYSAKKLPKGVDIDAASGKISGTMSTPGTYSVKVSASNGITSSDSSFTWTVLDRDGTGVQSQPLTGEVYTEWFKNQTLSDAPAVTGQYPLELDIQSNPPLSGFSATHYSVRWSTTIKPPVSGPTTLRFSVAAYDGIRVFLDDNLALDQWAASNAKPADYDIPVTLGEGKQVALKVEYWNKSGASRMLASWLLPGLTGFSPIPASVLTAGAITPVPSGAEPTLGPITSQWWKASNTNGSPVATRTHEPIIGLSLPSGSAPNPQVSSTGYTVRWTSEFTPKADGEYVFRVATSAYDGVRVYLGDDLLIDSWPTSASAKTIEGKAQLSKGGAVILRVEYTNYSGDSLLDLRVNLPGELGYAALPAPSLPAGSPENVAPGFGTVKIDWFNNITLTGAPKLVTTASQIALDVKAGQAPFSGFGTAFSTRFATAWTAATTGRHLLRTTIGIKDGVRVWVGGTLVLDKWSATNATRESFEVAIDLQAGEETPVVVEHADPSDEAYLQLQMVWPGSAVYETF